MLLVYATKTGNIKRFIEKIGLKNTLKIEVGNERVYEPYILLTYTTSFGKIPANVERFLEKNNKFMIGVAGSGNRNWGSLYCYAVNLIKEKYNVREIMKFELSGTINDVNKFKELIEKEEKNNEAYRIE